MPRRDKKIKPAKYTKQQLQSMSTKELERMGRELYKNLQGIING